MNRPARITALLALAALDVVLAACASTSTPPMSDPMPPVMAQCHADATQSLVGKLASADNVAMAQRQSGAALVRIIKPGQMVTMDFRADRLDIHVDTKNVILQIGCG